MLFFNKIKSKTFMILNHIKKKIDTVNNKKNSSLCRIEEIDIINKSIIIYCLGVSAPVKLSLDNLINDHILLSNLSPEHASWVGYYYGKYYGELINNQYSSISKFDFIIEDSTAKFRILMLDRKGNLIYLNENTRKNHTISPINAITNRVTITNFDSIQACYIGILAGIKYKNNSSRFLTTSKNSHLRLIN